MSRQTRAAWLLGAALVASSTVSLQAQVVPAATRSKPAGNAPPAAAAMTSFRSALYEVQNVAPERGRKQLEAALALSPEFGVAKAYQSFLAAGVPGAERSAQISGAFGAMGSASPAEVLLVTYWREQAAGRGAAAVPIIRAAAELAPDDPEINYIYDNTKRVGKPVAEQVASLRAFVQRFPKHAAAHNQLAYTLWRAGDREGALKAVEQYAALAPEHPNSHDSYADILILLGRGQEAVPHVQRIKQLDATWPWADAKLGTIALTANDVNGARTHFTAALNAATVPNEKVDAAYWLAATQVYAKNGKGAAEEMNRAVELAKSNNLPGQVVNAHAQAAIIEAYVGNRRNVAAHLEAAKTAAANDDQKANYLGHTAVALSRLGQHEQARAAVVQFAPLSGDDPEAVNSIEAILALDAKDYPAAEAAIQKLDNVSVLTRALRAELLLRTGKKAEGEALRKEVLASSVKLDGNPGVEFPSLIGRMRLMSL